MVADVNGMDGWMDGCACVMVCMYASTTSHNITLSDTALHKRHLILIMCDTSRQTNQIARRAKRISRLVVPWHMKPRRAQPACLS